MDNTSSKEATNTTTFPRDWPSVNIFTYVFGALSATWTIGANMTILVCYYRIRKRPWTSFTRQTCSMAVSDLIVGLTSIPLLVLEQNGGVLNGWLCSVTLYMFFAIQCVTLYHVLGICILRNIKMKTISEQVSQTNDNLYTNKAIVVSWTFPLLIILCPFLIWSKTKNEQTLCYIDEVFGTNLVFPTLFLSVTFLISQCLTNIIYIITYYRFRQVTRKTAPSQNSVSQYPVTSASNNEKRPRVHQKEVDRKQMTITNNGNIQNNEINTRIRSANQSQSRVHQERNQIRVISTIGILLVLYNVFTLPLTTMLFFGQPQSTNRSVRFIICSLFLINSGFNPIVYATRVAMLREAVKQFLKEVSGVFVACFR